jgi:excisionase family DNA binding protein
MAAEKIIPMARAASLSGIPVHTLRRLVAAGRIPHVVVGGVRRVRLSQVLASIEERGV